MEPPRAFTDRLTHEFHGRLRIRWSPKRGEWHLEHHVGRAVLPPLRIEAEDDTLIRFRDGYELVMAIRPGDRMPCPACGATLSLTPFVVQETKCRACQRAGRDTIVRAVYFPLGESLLEELRKRDPLRGGGARMFRMMEEANARLERERERTFANQHEDIAKDSFNEIFQIPQWGYTGRERYWPPQSAPAP